MLQTEELVILCVCVCVLLEYCDWVGSVWPSGAGVLQTEELVIVCVCLCLVRVLRLGVKCVVWASGDGVLQTEELVIVCVCVSVLLEYCDCV